MAKMGCVSHHLDTTSSSIKPTVLATASQLTHRCQATKRPNSKVTDGALLMRVDCHFDVKQLKKSDSLEHQSSVGSTKPKVVLDGYIDAHVTRGVGTVIKIAIGIGVLQVDGGRTLLMTDS